MPDFIKSVEDAVLGTYKGVTKVLTKYWRHEYKKAREFAVDTYEYARYEAFTVQGLKTLLKEIRDNLKSGLTVALVSLPLSISLAVAADSLPIYGVSTAIFAGFFCSLLGGSHYNIVGPTGALSGILSRYAITYRNSVNAEVLPFLSLFTGLLCLFIWFVGWHKYITLVPSSVIHGFTVGVAFIIGLNQLNFALGLPKLPRHESFVDNVSEQLSNISLFDPWALVFFLSAFAVLFALVSKFPKLPWNVVIAGIGIGIGYLGSEGYLGDVNFATLYSRYGDLDISKIIEVPSFAGQGHLLSFDILSATASIAFVAILETLISAKIADVMTKTTSSQEREMFGLAIGNIAVGVTGGIPATAALARTSLNIKSGATSRVSGILAAIFLTIISLALIQFFKFLPLPVVAAILLMVAIRMIETHHIVRMFQVDKRAFMLTLITAAVCVIIEPTMGIIVGLVLTLLILSKDISGGHSEVIIKHKDTAHMPRVISTPEIAQFSEEMRIKKKKRYANSGAGPTESSLSRVQSTDHIESQDHISSMDNLDLNAEGVQVIVPRIQTSFDESSSNIDGVPVVELENRTVVYRISGQLTYINAMGHVGSIKLFEEHADTFVLGLRYLFYIDVDGLEAIDEIIEHLEHAGKKVVISGINISIGKMIKKSKYYAEKKQKGEIFYSVKDALHSIDAESDDESIPEHIRIAKKKHQEQQLLKEEEHHELEDQSHVASTSADTNIDINATTTTSSNGPRTYFADEERPAH